MTDSISRRDICRTLALAPLVAVLPTGANAQAFPTKPVRFILPFGAGGVADVTSRLVAEKLGEKLGQRFVVENMPGAGGITAARAALIRRQRRLHGRADHQRQRDQRAAVQEPAVRPGEGFRADLVHRHVRLPVHRQRKLALQDAGRLGEGRAGAARQAQRRHHHRGLDAAPQRRAVQVERQPQFRHRADQNLGRGGGVAAARRRPDGDRLLRARCAAPSPTARRGRWPGAARCRRRRCRTFRPRRRPCRASR